MNIEQCKETYEMLKKGKQFVANIDKDFFLNFEELLFNELKKKDDQIEYIKNEYGRTIEEKDKVINEMAEWISRIDPTIYCDKEKCNDNCKECVIKEFTNKVEREGK